MTTSMLDADIWLTGSMRCSVDRPLKLETTAGDIELSGKILVSQEWLDRTSSVN